MEFKITTTALLLLAGFAAADEIDLGIPDLPPIPVPTPPELTSLVRQGDPTLNLPCTDATSTVTNATHTNATVPFPCSQYLDYCSTELFGQLMCRKSCNRCEKCEDIFPSCPAMKPLCDDPKADPSIRLFLKLVYCKKSCGTCQSECESYNDRLCDRYKRKGYCTDNRKYRGILYYCRNHCDTCHLKDDFGSPRQCQNARCNNRFYSQFLCIGTCSKQSA